MHFPPNQKGHLGRLWPTSFFKNRIAIYFHHQQGPIGPPRLTNRAGALIPNRPPAKGPGLDEVGGKACERSSNPVQREQ